MLDIDFNKLIANEKDATIKSMHEYFSKQQPTEKNEYTGMFKGKNLVVFVAEAFSQLAIDEQLTPTLYKLYHEGFQFDNFYTPVFPVSTADGEYITDTSLIPKEGVWSMYRIKGNYMPYSYANVFENLGYTSQSYHNNNYNYYDRDIYLKTMGYDSYRACGNGLNINCRAWPESDYEMIQDSVNDFINDDHFMAYYMTVSGHLEYNRSGNNMTNRNWNAVKDLPYSSIAKSYLAANIELDKAVAELIKDLEAAGKLDDTVISISADHYPYGLSIEQINELSTYKRDSNFEIHHMPFLLWNSTMEKPIKITKYGSSLDVLPTILNLFGVDYDSRLLMGTDILSNSDGLVIFSNRSFITKEGQFNSITKKFTGNQVADDYVENINFEIFNKYKYSRLI
jgi:phosphoglycerol transferase MdoB-like AlkP superfamily enzyme